MLLNIVTGVLFATVISLVAWYRKWLSSSGAIAAIIMGAIVWAIGQWQAALPLLLFFISSSFFSLAFRGSRSVVDKKDHQPRDAMQVACNGGIATICLLILFMVKNEAWMWAYWASIAMSTADTWSSAIGNRFAGKVVDIRNGRAIEKGLSGGISIAGTAGGFAGAAFIAIAGLLLMKNGFPWLSVLVAGFAGMIIDSLMGSYFQARYRLTNGGLIEYSSAETATLEKGWRWLDNDLVNLLSNAIATGLALLVFQ